MRAGEIWTQSRRVELQTTSYRIHAYSANLQVAFLFFSFFFQTFIRFDYSFKLYYSIVHVCACVCIDVIFLILFINRKFFIDERKFDRDNTSVSSISLLLLTFFGRLGRRLRVQGSGDLFLLQAQLFIIRIIRMNLGI